MIRSKVIESEPMFGKKGWFYVRTDCKHYLQRQANKKTGDAPKYVLCEECAVIAYRKQGNGRSD